MKLRKSASAALADSGSSMPWMTLLRASSTRRIRLFGKDTSLVTTRTQGRADAGCGLSWASTRDSRLTGAGSGRGRGHQQDDGASGGS